MSDPVNLATIIGREGYYPEDAFRVAEFQLLDDGTLQVGEKCDDYFGVSLEPAEVDKLIAYLRGQRARMAGVPLSIIGRERHITDTLATLLLNAAKRYHEYTTIERIGRGSTFGLAIMVDDELTGHTVRVTIELDRYVDPRDASKPTVT